MRFFGMIFRGKLSVLTVCALLGLSACQDRLIVENKGALGSNIVRLGDTAVANVDGTNIYLSDVERAAAAQKLIEPGTPLSPKDAVFQKVLDELIDQRLMALSALRQSLDQGDEAQRRLAVSRERILSSLLVEDHLKKTVNETTLRKMYDGQASMRNRGNEIRARHILVGTKDEINAVVKRLGGGEDFGDVAKDISLDRTSRENAGDLGFFTKDMLTQSFTDVAFSAPQGVVSEPFESEFGWHVLEVLGKRKGKQPSFEEMRDEILNFMTYDEIQNLVKALRAGGDIQLLFGQAVMDKPINNQEDINASDTLAPDTQTPELRESQAPAPVSDDE